MTKTLFNPFDDRLSRDIRNNLSEGLAEAVETGSTEKLVQTVAYYRQQHLAGYYHAYLEDRYARYTEALEKMQGNDSSAPTHDPIHDPIHDTIHDPIQQGVILWDLGLFFEVHEVLEHAWYSAEGDMKATLQALIRAAGVYIKREYGFDDAAGRIAAKAIPVLRANNNILDNYFDTEKLISALKNPSDAPPILA